MRRASRAFAHAVSLVLPRSSSWQSVDGITGSGTCACATGWTGALCDSCAPGFFNSTCQPCPSCLYGRCLDGLTGNGTCACDAGWYGTLCDSFQSGELQPLPVRATDLADGLTLVTLLATVTSPPFTAFASAPSLGSLPVPDEGWCDARCADFGGGQAVTDLRGVCCTRPPLVLKAA